jgi:hypothetical protein
MANQTKIRLLVLFLLGVVLFNFPIVELMSRDYTVAGIPGLYFSLFLCWGLFIWLIKRWTEPEKPSRP